MSMPNSEEIQWINKIKAGEASFFTKLYGRYHGRLYALCYQFTRNSADAEEQLQEIFLKILAKIEGFRQESTFATWASRLAVNHLINFQNRRRDTMFEQLDESRHLEQTDSGPSQELSLSLAKAILELPAGYRQIFILHEQLGLTHVEIAELLEITAATSRSQLCRARLTLKEMLTDHPVEVEMNRKNRLAS
jgi:RNA polymerase sigma-70 factor (ECF subfamily)